MLVLCETLACSENFLEITPDDDNVEWAGKSFSVIQDLSGLDVDWNMSLTFRNLQNTRGLSKQ